MKQIKVTDFAATIIENLRTNSWEALDIAKVSVADGMSALARLMQIGRDCPDIGDAADELLAVMFTLSEYNRLIDMLVCMSDVGSPAKYYLKDAVIDRGEAAK